MQGVGIVVFKGDEVSNKWLAERKLQESEVIMVLKIHTNTIPILSSTNRQRLHEWEAAMSAL